MKLDDATIKIIEEALKKESDDKVVEFLVQNASQLSKDVRNRLIISLIGAGLKEQTQQINDLNEFLKSIIEAGKIVDAKGK